MARFGQTTDAELETKRLGLHAAKTKKSNAHAARIFREYLLEKQEDTGFESFSVSRLDESLSRFYVDARKEDGSFYRGTSLESLRYGLNRYLKAPPINKSFDIVKDPEFRSANYSFKAAMAELKRMGNACVKHYPPLSKADLQKLYSSMHLATNTPAGLFNKVQLDIRLYFCRRGGNQLV